MKGNINATITATLAGVLYSLKALLDPDVPNNQGLIEIVDINAPLGTLSMRNSPRRSRRAPTRPAHRRRGDRRARAGDPRGGGRRRERRQHDRGVFRPRSAPRPRLCLSRNARRRLRRALHQGRQGRRAGAHHQHLEPAGRVDRDGVSAAGRELRLRRGFRRRRANIAAGWVCAAWCGRSVTQ